MRGRQGNHNISLPTCGYDGGELGTTSPKTRDDRVVCAHLRVEMSLKSSANTARPGQLPAERAFGSCSEQHSHIAVFQYTFHSQQHAMLVTGSPGWCQSELHSYYYSFILYMTSALIPSVLLSSSSTLCLHNLTFLISSRLPQKVAQGHKSNQAYNVQASPADRPSSIHYLIMEQAPIDRHISLGASAQPTWQLAGRQ